MKKFIGILLLVNTYSAFAHPPGIIVPKKCGLNALPDSEVVRICLTEIETGAHALDGEHLGGMPALTLQRKDGTLEVFPVLSSRYGRMYVITGSVLQFKGKNAIHSAGLRVLDVGRIDNSVEGEVLSLEGHGSPKDSFRVEFK